MRVNTVIGPSNSNRHGFADPRKFNIGRPRNPVSQLDFLRSLKAGQRMRSSLVEADIDAHGSSKAILLSLAAQRKNGAVETFVPDRGHLQRIISGPIRLTQQNIKGGDPADMQRNE